MTAVVDAHIAEIGGILDLSTGDTVSETIWDGLVGNVLFNYKRRVVELTNKSGGSVAAGDVVILDASNDSAFTTTSSADNGLVIGVAQETIANNAAGKIQTAGLATVNVTGSVARGAYLGTSGTVKLAYAEAGPTGGTFARALTADSAGAVTALLGPVSGATVRYSRGGAHTNGMSNGTAYYPITLYANSGNATEVNVSSPCPHAAGAVVRRLYIATNATQNAGGSLVFTLMKNGSPAALTVTVPAGTSAGVIADTTNSVTFAAGDLWSMKVVNNYAGTSAGFSWELEIDPI